MHEIIGASVYKQYKKLSRCWESATCEPLDAEITVAKCAKLHTFIHTKLVFGITRSGFVLTWW